jgi:hypothetical protein
MVSIVISECCYSRMNGWKLIRNGFYSISHTFLISPPRTTTAAVASGTIRKGMSHGNGKTHRSNTRIIYIFFLHCEGFTQRSEGLMVVVVGRRWGEVSHFCRWNALVMPKLNFSHHGRRETKGEENWVMVESRANFFSFFFFDWRQSVKDVAR